MLEKPIKLFVYWWLLLSLPLVLIQKLVGIAGHRAFNYRRHFFLPALWHSRYQYLQSKKSRSLISPAGASAMAAFHLYKSQRHY